DTTRVGERRDPGVQAGGIDEASHERGPWSRGAAVIARVWLGSTPAALADDYAGYLDRTGVPDLAATEGNLGVLVLRRVGPDTAVFTVISLWEDMDAVRRFAGADPDRAVYYPE